MRRFLMLIMPLLLLSGMLSGCVWWHDDERGSYEERHDGYRDEEHHRHEHEREYGNHDDDRYRDHGGGYRYDGGYPGGGYPGGYLEGRR